MRISPRFAVVFSSFLTERAFAALQQFDPEVVRGDPDNGDCYMVLRTGTRSSGPYQGPILVLPTVNCRWLDLEFSYYNGGVDENGVDTGVPEIHYTTVQVSLVSGCDNTTLNDCRISVEGVGGCDPECILDEETNTLTLVDCGSLDTFLPGNQTVPLEPPYLKPLEPPYLEFFTLAPNDEHCAAYAAAQIGPPLSPPPTATPTDDTPGLLELELEATMEFGFFENADLREPQPQELEGFVKATTNFFTEVLEADFRFESFEAVLAGSDFDERAYMPLRIHFDAVAIFDEPDNDMGRSITITSKEELFAAMEGANYQKYIHDYLWSISSTSIFFDTQKVSFNKRLADFPIPVTGSPTTATTSTMAPTSAELFIQEDILYGDHDERDCYAVQRKIQRLPADPQTGCISHTMVYTYYNGGTDLDGNDSGSSREHYANVTLEFEHACLDLDTADYPCSLSVDEVGTCQCMFERLVISHGPPSGPPQAAAKSSREWAEITFDCSELDGVFPSGSKSMVIWNDDPEPPLEYTNEFFPLASDDERCEHPALDFYSQKDVLHGDSNDGECYDVERSMVRFPLDENSGCILHTVDYTYYIGGVDINGVDSGYPRESYAHITAEFTHDCNDSDDDKCSLSVDGVGTCLECEFLVLALGSGPPPRPPPGTPDDAPPPTDWSRYWSELHLKNCSNLEGVFPPGEQTIEFSKGKSLADFFSSYTEEYFTLESDESEAIESFVNVQFFGQKDQVTERELTEIEESMPLIYRNLQETAFCDPDMRSLDSAELRTVDPGPTDDSFLLGFAWEGTCNGEGCSDTNMFFAPSGQAFVPCGVDMLEGAPIIEDFENDLFQAILALRETGDVVNIQASGDAVEVLPGGTPSPRTAPAPTPSRCKHPLIVDRLSEAPTRAPNEPIVVCSDQWTDGAMVEGKCYAVDKFSRVEEKETYHFVEVKAAYNCDPATNSGQPADGCSISLKGEDCLQCINDGSEATMEDCTNHAGIFQPPRNQVISLLREDSVLDIVETNAMCSHPAVTMSTDKSAGGGSLSTRNGGFNKADKTTTMAVLLKLEFGFVEGKGKEPDSDALNLLAANTIDFYRTVLLDDPTFGNIVVGLTMEDIKDAYLTALPDVVHVDMKAKLEIDAASAVKIHQAADVFGNADLNKHVRQFVRNNKLGRRNALFHVRSVHLKAVARG